MIRSSNKKQKWLRQARWPTTATWQLNTLFSNSDGVPRPTVWGRLRFVTWSGETSVNFWVFRRRFCINGFQCSVAAPQFCSWRSAGVVSAPFSPFFVIFFSKSLGNLFTLGKKEKNNNCFYVIFKATFLSVAYSAYYRRRRELIMSAILATRSYYHYFLARRHKTCRRDENIKIRKWMLFSS